MPVNSTHPAITAFYEKRQALIAHRAVNEQQIREAFKSLLETLAKEHKWQLLVEVTERVNGHRIIYDGALRDVFNLTYGYWESKDQKDDLNTEINKKFALGYSGKNTIFEDSRRAILYQNRGRVGEYDLDKPADVALLFNQFFSYTDVAIDTFKGAVEQFKADVADLAAGLMRLIGSAHATNKKFSAAFADFLELSRASLNPNLSAAAVDEMLIQHLLTERLIRTVFDNPEFVQRNVIAAEIEKVIAALTSQAFNRAQFLAKLDPYYNAIERTAETLADFSEKQAFLNTVYERFFQGYAVKVADTHGIVYTPQPIVDFMCAAVEEVLQDEFGLKLTDPQVCIIDPATGTGNFVVNLLRRIYEADPAALPDVYANRLFANEVMLLPYYIASLNIEHAYFEYTGQYAPFDGLCFVDTLDLAEGRQQAMFTETNTARVERQKAAPITVILGNPPYNAGQVNENDNNKNRKYPVIDRRVQETYARASAATNKNALSDPYVKFFRWATDRLGDRDGVVCLVTNNSFADQLAFDGMRKHLLENFHRVYHLDLHGNVRQNPKLSGTTHNVFGIQVGVGITIAVKSARYTDHQLFYHRVPETWTRTEKLDYMRTHVAEDGTHNALNTVEWLELTPDARHNWRIADNAAEFAALIPIGSKVLKAARAANVEAIFKTFSGGVKTSRDDVVYDFDRQLLNARVRDFINDYNGEVGRYMGAGKPKDVDSFVHYDRIKWSRDLKLDLQRVHFAQYSDGKIRDSFYRPFCKQYLFFDRILNEEVYVFPSIFPTSASEAENKLICFSGLAHDVFYCLLANCIAEYKFSNAANGGTQSFPFYTYNEDGSNRRENITDWALEQFQAHYNDPTITKWDIFYYVYGLLHHPSYRSRYAAALKRDLPRIPFAPEFRPFAEVGKQLADLHLHYEEVEQYPLKYHWTAKPISYRVEKMRLSPDKKSLFVNSTLTLEGIPPQAFEYRLGNRSALDWIIDQYQVTTDKRSGITSDPNLYSEDEKYIVHLVGRVVNVSVQTVALVNQLAALPFLPQPTPA